MTPAAHRRYRLTCWLSVEPQLSDGFGHRVVSEITQLEEEILMQALVSSSKRVNRGDGFVDSARSLQIFREGVKFKL
jgi:hypothetical protein